MFSREDYRSWKLGKCGWKLWINHFFFLTYFSSTRCLMFDGILFESLKGACIILQKSCKSFLLFCCCSFVINNGRLPACFCSLSAPLLLSSVVWEVPTKWGSLQMAALGSKHQGHFTVYFETRCHVRLQQRRLLVPVCTPAPEAETSDIWDMIKIQEISRFSWLQMR